jgi:ribonuclease D
LAPQSLQSFRELETDIKLAMPDYSGGRGLKALINNLMDEPCTRLKTKKITMSNWEMRKLSDDQLAYAAMDALCGMMLWEIIDAKRGKQGYD